MYFWIQHLKSKFVLYCKFLSFIFSNRGSLPAMQGKLYMTFKVKKAGVILEEMQGLWEILWHFEPEFVIPLQQALAILCLVGEGSE